MIEIAKAGKAAFKPGVKPQDICPYKTLGAEQLAWSIGFYKAAADHMKGELAEIRSANNALMKPYLKNAYEQGRRSFIAGQHPIETCPYMGQQFVVAYVKGWRSAEEKYNDSQSQGGTGSLPAGSETGDSLPVYDLYVHGTTSLAPGLDESPG